MNIFSAAAPTVDDSTNEKTFCGLKFIRLRIF